jgi:ribosomal protein S12 methylthiotransferase
MPERVALINLGCPKNVVDAEVMLGHLRQSGYELTTRLEEASVVVVNTCGFLEASAQESVNTLLETASRKQDGGLRAVIAAGCMPQRYGADVVEAMPEIDGFLGVGQAHRLPEMISRVLNGGRHSFLKGPSAGFEGYGLRLPSTPSHTAYLKVSEGCDRHCAFCIIPAIRGPMASRRPADLEAEARELARRGVRELVLVGQDPTRYGVDLAREARGLSTSLPELLTVLNSVEELRWIRLMYLFPDRSAASVLEAIARLPRVCKYVDMPFQHSSANVLRMMNRPGSGDEHLRLLQQVRAACPEISIRSTAIVGHPGESAEEFRELCEFVEAAQLDWLAVFRYSPEEGTPAALLPRPDNAIARERYEVLMALQQRVTRRVLQRWVGRTVEAVVEDPPGKGAAGFRARARFAGQAPEVDGSTLVAPGPVADLRPGDFVRALVTDVSDYDLLATACSLEHRPPRPGQELVQLLTA